MGNYTPERSLSSFPLIPALILFGGLALPLLFILASQPRAAQPARPATTEVAVVATAVPTLVPTEVVLPETVSYTPEQVARGESLYMTTCSACHGMNALGVPGLGKDLVHSEFLASLTDTEVHDFIVVGRQASDPLNTTGQLMPAMGGNPTLTDDDIYNIIAYLRVNADVPADVSAPAAESTVDTGFVLPIDALGLNSALPTSAPAAESTVDTGFVLPIDALGLNRTATPQPTAAATGEAAAGEVDVVRVYAISCSGCHGTNGEGIPGVAAPLSASALLEDDAAMVNFLVTGQTETQLPYPHPPIGETEARALVEYLDTLVSGG